jgi:hypothetical protein
MIALSTTVTIHFAGSASAIDAEMVVVPTARAVTIPLASTFAISGLLDSHVIGVITSLGVIVVCNVYVSSKFNVIEVGDKVIIGWIVGSQPIKINIAEAIIKNKLFLFISSLFYIS